MTKLRMVFETVLMVLIVGVGGGTVGQAGPPEPISFLHYYGLASSSAYAYRAINALVDVINRDHPEFSVKAVNFEQEAFKTAIKAMLAGGNPPDLFTYWAGAKVQALVDAGYLEPLDDLWAQANLNDRFTPAITQAVSHNGHQYALPLTIDYAAFFYNAKIFREHGLTAPTTWVEFIEVCRRLKAAGVTPIALGARERWPAQFWFDYLLLRTAGPDYRQKLMLGQAAYTDPEVKQAYALWKEMMDQGFFNQNPQVYDWWDAGKMVFSGQAAMTLMGSWIMALFDGQLGWQQQRDYDFFSFPVIDANVPLTAVGPIACVALPRERKAAAKTVLAYFSEIAPQQAMSQIIGSLSSNKNVPAAFYTPMQQRILKIIGETPHWAFNYDLATPPPVAEIGLNSFVEFLKQPDRYPEILEKTQQQAQQYFQVNN